MNKKTFSLRTLPKVLLSRLTMQHWFQRSLLPFGKDLNPDRWIFVIGCYNSGTTLLASILRQHPELAGLPTEGAFLTDSLPYPEEFGWPRMWCECLDKVRMETNSHGAQLALRIKKHWSIWYPRNARNLVEKSVANAARLPFLNRYFAPAYFIYIVRNGYVISKSIQDKANLTRWENPTHKKRYPLELCAKQWSVTDEVVERDSSQVQQVMTVYYEDLVNDPACLLLKVTDFLGIAPLPDAVFRKHWAIHEKVEPIKNMNASVLGRLSTEELTAIQTIAGERLLKHGYLPA